MFGLHRMIQIMSRTARPLTLVLLGLAGLSCADSSSYLYRPAENATAMTEGFTAARYVIPATAPKGDVRVASFGVRDVGRDENGPDWPAVHVRLIVSNDSGAEAWTVDTREVQVELRGEKPLPPAAVNADANELPEIHIAPGEERTLDLYYPLPENVNDASNVPAFDVLWKVHTEAGITVERTPFERLAPVQNSSIGYGMGYGMGYSPYWWGNSGYYSSYSGGMFGAGMTGPNIVGPAGGSRFFVHAHPGLRH